MRDRMSLALSQLEHLEFGSGAGRTFLQIGDPDNLPIAWPCTHVELNNAKRSCSKQTTQRPLSLNQMQELTMPLDHFR